MNDKPPANDAEMVARVSSTGISAYVLEVQRREGNWHRCEMQHGATRDLFRYAAALGRWIGVAHGNVAAVRVLPKSD